jgi:hypothetical protein
MFTKGNHMSNKFLPILIMLTLSGCFPAMVIKDTITKYESVESQIELGDSKQKVLSILNPTQKGLQSDWKKRPEKYIKKGILVEIFYFRTGLQSDGLTTDDEFTPYVFNNGNLVAVGWTFIGGAKSQGQTIPQTNVTVRHSTIVY